MNALLAQTKLLDFEAPEIRQLISARGWAGLPLRERILKIYDFVRDEIAFGYNVDDAIPASRVLLDGYGQCNTKGILFMALLRGVDVPCRFHGFTIDKELQKGALSGLWYRLAPQEIVHSWVEVEYAGRFVNLEGFILDVSYLTQVQRIAGNTTGGFCGYGVATDCIEAPAVYWEGGDTYIQKEGIRQDFGIYESPDDFFASHRQAIGAFKRFLYRYVIRHDMNRNVAAIRGREWARGFSRS